VIIRREHVERLAERQLADLVERTVAEVRDLWPEECGRLGRPAVPQLVEDAVNRARAWGLLTERDVGRFVHLVFALEDPAFDEAPWAAAILGDEALSPRARTSRLWDEVKRRFGEGDEG
jgi:hypothetical protein